MTRVLCFAVACLYSLATYAKSGEVRVNFFPEEEEDKGVIGILKNEDNDRPVVEFRKDLKPGRYSFKLKEGRYLVVCMKYSYNHSLQTHPITVKKGSTTEVVCDGVPDSDFIELKGVVIDKVSGLPIAGAKVGYYPVILPPELLPHYTQVIRTKTGKFDMGDEMRFLRKYNLDRYLYSLTDKKGKFKMFVYINTIKKAEAVHFSVFADGYAPFFYKKRVNNVLNTPLDVGTIELIASSNVKVSLTPPLKKDIAIYLKPVDTEIESFPHSYFIFSPYRRFGTSVGSPVFLKDKFVWSFVYPWIYSVKYSVKRPLRKQRKRRPSVIPGRLALYEVKEKDNKEIILDTNECEYAIEVVGIDNEDDKVTKVSDKEELLVSIRWRGRDWVVDSASLDDLKKTVKVKDIVKGKSFIETYLEYGEPEEVFIEEVGFKYEKRLSTTHFFSRVVMGDCLGNKKIKVELENQQLSFVIKDDRGRKVKNAKVFVYLHNKRYEPLFSCVTRSDKEGKAVCKYLKSGEYLVFIHHPKKGYFGPETFTTSNNGYQVTLKKGKDLQVEVLSPEYKSIGKGISVTAVLEGTHFSLSAATTEEGEEAKFYGVVTAKDFKESNKEEKRYIAKFSNLPYHNIYLFPKKSVVTFREKGWVTEAFLVDKEKEGYVQLIVESGSGAAVFEGKSTGDNFDDSYRVYVCKKGGECLSYFNSEIVPSPTGGFVITGLAPGEYKVKIVPIYLGENRKPLESPFFRIYPDQHTVIEEGSFRK